LTEEAHASDTQARRELQALKASESQLRAELEKAQARAREVLERPPPAAVPTQAVTELQSVREQLEAAKSELERQVASADKHAREAKRHEQELRDEVRKHKGRAETNNRVYLVTKGELELVKERLAQAERKLWQAGTPMPPPTHKDRPKATGPAAAERSREEHADTPAPEPTLQAASPEAAAAGEPIGAEEAGADVERQAVPMPRRQTENGAEKKPV